MATAFFRTVILYILIMAGLRLMGKRQIGELEPSELVLTLVISDLAAVPMQDFGIPLLNGIFPILILMSITLITSILSLRSIRFRAVICGKPVIIIREGKILQKNMASTRLTVDELYEQLRTQGYTCPSAVKYAILETSGQLSILPYTKEAPVTPAVLDTEVQDSVTLPILVINDGHVMEEDLKSCGRNMEWLQKELRARKLSSPAQVFVLTVDQEGAVLCIPKEGRT